MQQPEKLTQTEQHFLFAALKHVKDNDIRIIKENEQQGKRSVLAPQFMELLYNEIYRKLQQLV
jgi:hypothetical protein